MIKAIVGSTLVLGLVVFSSNQEVFAFSTSDVAPSKSPDVGTMWWAEAGAAAAGGAASGAVGGAAAGAGGMSWSLPGTVAGAATGAGVGAVAGAVGGAVGYAVSSLFGFTTSDSDQQFSDIVFDH